MIKGNYINKIADSVYRVELGDRSVDINVSDPQDQSTIDQELAEIKTGIETSEVGVLVRPDVIWRGFNIAKVLRKYDYDAANCWCAHEWGGLAKMVEYAIRLINSQFYGAAGQFLEEMEEVAYSFKEFPVVAGAVFENDAAYQEWEAEDEE
jgi:hypothetical protein